ncbi:MAG: hypothetical protein WC822_05460 [Candidatus Paceibacterota bacterium]
MLGENKNLKDFSPDSVKDTKNMPAPYEAGSLRSGSVVLSYTKTNKLITALYMVTDTMEKEEPIRLKLRTLGIEILSDIPAQAGIVDISKTAPNIQKIDQILSFLNITSDIGMISEMNSNILKKEFTELKQSIKEATTHKNLWLEEFLAKPAEENSSIGHVSNSSQSNISRYLEMSFNKGQDLSKGQTGVRIGVQKGSTLLKALNKIGDVPALRNFSEDREILKNKRREAIIKIIKDKPNGVSIKDIVLAMKSLGEVTGEKTLQRELVSMVKDNVLKKTGEKRWSQYSLN